MAHATRTVAAWDGPTRVFHWLLFALTIAGWVSFEFAEDIDDGLLVWHRWNGLAVLVVLVWRLLWGVFGSSTARFAEFAPSPASAWRHARLTWAGTAPRYLGHNPLGSLMIIGLLAILFVQAGLGLFAVDDNDLTGGPLHRLISEAVTKEATRRHDFIFHFVLLPLIGLHIAANVLYGLLKKEPLIQAMVTGKKPAEEYADAPAAILVANPWARAFACLIAAKLIVFGGIWLAGGRLL
ncbi:MAG: cytochrome b/b6 domain-containing protein [Hyphomicrobium sp.]